MEIAIGLQASGLHFNWVARTTESSREEVVWDAVENYLHKK
jgi:hypothetical protein